MKSEYLVYHEEYSGKKPNSIMAYSPDDAACLYAEEYNTSSDYCLLNEEVRIRVEKDGTSKWFKISAEETIDYFADEIEQREVVIWLDITYTNSDLIKVPEFFSEEQITSAVKDKHGDNWYSYDIN